MRRTSYREQNYAFGQRMLTLRTALGLTQAELANILGISRNAVGGWTKLSQSGTSQAPYCFRPAARCLC